MAVVLRELDYDVVEMLLFEADATPDDENCLVAFEWIGKRNYLEEHFRSRVAEDAERKRGQNFTSLVDFVFRFRRSDGLIQIVAGEWKYTERYANGRCIQRNQSGTDRLKKFYAPALDATEGPIVLNGLSREVLFFDPFDQ